MNADSVAAIRAQLGELVEAVAQLELDTDAIVGDDRIVSALVSVRRALMGVGVQLMTIRVAP